MPSFSRPPPYVKANEKTVPYNTFWVDLSMEKGFKLDKKWMMDGINVNWLMKEDGNGTHSRLILGIEAEDVGAMRSFLDEFFPVVSRNMSNVDLEKMLLLGHPTLACEIRSGATIQSTYDTVNGNAKGLCGTKIAGRMAQRAEDAFKEQNYRGVIGGELHYQDDNWYVDDGSGRYGEVPDASPQQVDGLKAEVVNLFLRYTGTKVLTDWY